MQYSPQDFASLNPRVPGSLGPRSSIDRLLSGMTQEIDAEPDTTPTRMLSQPHWKTKQQYLEQSRGVEYLFSQTISGLSDSEALFSLSVA